MKRQRIVILLIGAACALLVAGPVACRAGSQGSKVVINGHAFTVQIADTPAARQTGLSNRGSLPADQGMLFLFERAAPVQFYMKDCYFNIDIAFIDAEKHIINLDTMPVEADPADPKRYYYSDRPAKYVLETVGGTWKRIGAEPGMSVSFVGVNDKN
jgi:uncharacterized protein